MQINQFKNGSLPSYMRHGKQFPLQLLLLSVIGSVRICYMYLYGIGFIICSTICNSLPSVLFSVQWITIKRTSSKVYQINFIHTEKWSEIELQTLSKKPPIWQALWHLQITVQIFLEIVTATQAYTPMLCIADGVIGCTVFCKLIVVHLNMTYF